MSHIGKTRLDFSYKTQLRLKEIENEKEEKWSLSICSMLGEKLIDHYESLKEKKGGILFFFPSYGAMI